jgi:hypothetical protein
MVSDRGGRYPTHSSSRRGKSLQIVSMVSMPAGELHRRIAAPPRVLDRRVAAAVEVLRTPGLDLLQ